VERSGFLHGEVEEVLDYRIAQENAPFFLNASNVSAKVGYHGVCILIAQRTA